MGGERVGVHFLGVGLDEDDFVVRGWGGWAESSVIGSIDEMSKSTKYSNHVVRRICDIKYKIHNSIRCKIISHLKELCRTEEDSIVPTISPTRSMLSP